MSSITSWKDLFDEIHEIAAWVVMLFAGVGLGVGFLDQWPGVALMGIGLVTLLGTQRYKGLRLPGGSGVDGGSCDARKD